MNTVGALPLRRHPSNVARTGSGTGGRVLSTPAKASAVAPRTPNITFMRSSSPQHENQVDARLLSLPARRLHATAMGDGRDDADDLTQSILERQLAQIVTSEIL
jgi:hypothetical protein